MLVSGKVESSIDCIVRWHDFWRAVEVGQPFLAKAEMACSSETFGQKVSQACNRNPADGLNE